MNTQQRPRIFLFVPDGIGVRNYLFSDLIQHLQPAHVGMFHKLPALAVSEIESLHRFPLEVHNIPAFGESKKERLLRDLATFARLIRNSRIRSNYRIWKSLFQLKKSNPRQAWYYRLVVLASYPLSFSIKTIVWIDKTLSQSYAKGPYANGFYQMLEKAKPDVILCTHQRVPSASLMASVAHSLNIPVVSAIFSWDNLPKSRITLNADQYIVWSDFMRGEMQAYYPEILDNNIKVTGTPQFECYRKTALHWSKEEFCQRLGLPVDKKIVLLSGNDLSSPNDQYYFEDIASAVAALPESERPHLLLRKAPVDSSGRFKQLAEKYKAVLTVSDPAWNTGDAVSTWSEILPTFEDVVLLTNLCLHCDLVVNIGSTMGLDFAQFNKPAVYINYDKPFNANWYNIGFIYGLEHFRTLDNLDAVLWIKSQDEIMEVLQRGLKQPDGVATDRLKWRYLLTNDIAHASANIATLLKNIAANKMPQ
jgi:hypothetical protein